MIKKLTIATGKVSGTNASFPVYIKPSAITNFGTLTLAEAQSSRIYTDVDLVTQIAREITSADELHTKYPSFVQASEIYIDYDGIRADYAVTDTYGRNAVWSGYAFVSHDGGIDSTGVRTMTANGGVVAGNVTGQVGGATSFVSSSSQNFSMSNTTGLPAGDSSLTMQQWVKPTSVVASQISLGLGTFNTNLRSTLFEGSYGGINGSFSFSSYNNDFTQGTVITAGVWNMICATYTTVTKATVLYVDGVNVKSGNLTSTKNTTYGAGRIGTNEAGGEAFGGDIDETRIRTDVLLSTWITTEYNNQSSVSTFFNAATDVVVVTRSSRRAMELFSM